ncbi:PA14 domain-containing protein [Marinobacter sp. GN3S48]|uniref:PA14 domain-containing protein n=1 Tax=Marinobacter sp. GN3S48 TaxID=3382302 RepID=UPI00387B0987
MSVCKVLGVGSAVILISGCQSWQFRGIEDLPPTAALPEESQPGVVEVRYYDNLDGIQIDTMTASEKFPDNPDEVAELTSLEDPENRAEYYGSYVRGFIEPPSSGEYRFFVSGNDQAEFWLSTSDSPNDVELLAMTPDWTNVNEFTKYSSQTSRYVTLDSSKQYYFEVLQKEGYGSDHFAVAWEGPGISQQIIGSAYIHSWAKPVYGDDVSSGEAYSLGYRVGFLDGSEGLAFNPDYPPLDADKDGIYDNWEVVYGLDPSNPDDAASDPDGDLLAAADEFLIGTAENNPDTDGDGIPDGSEYAYDLDPLDASDAEGDLDNDGYTNLEEYQAGTALNDHEDMPVEEAEPEPEAEPQFIAGFTGQYFEGTSFDRLVLTQVNESVDFNWGRGSPNPDMPSDQFSVRWSGTFTAPHSSGSNNYEFTVRTNDGVRLYANGELVIDDWTQHAPTSFSYERSLEAGEQLNLTVEYFEDVGSAVAQYSARNITTNQNLSTASTVTTPDYTSPSSQDTDGDGIPDTWELQHGLNAWVPDADGVNNNDGISNLQAYESGLDPYTLETVETDGDGTTGEEPETTEPETTDPGTVDSSVTLSWTAPSTRMDGSSIDLSEIDYYIINYGQSESDLSSEQEVSGELTSYTFDGLASGTWYFTIQVVDTNGLTSAPSSPVSAEVQ